MSELNEILNANNNKIKKDIDAGIKVGAFGVEELRLLHEAESQGQKRQGVLAMLASAMDVMANSELSEGGEGSGDTAENSSQNDEQAGKKARGEKPDWQNPDYTGPMTCEIAEWRNANIKTK